MTHHNYTFSPAVVEGLMSQGMDGVLEMFRIFLNEAMEEEKLENFRKVFHSIAFLGDIEGTIGVMVRVWPTILLLLQLASKKFILKFVCYRLP